MDYILEEMNKLGADGVDFVPIWLDRSILSPVICSYTKKEWGDIKTYPKSNRMYWKMIDGQKVYINK